SGEKEISREEILTIAGVTVRASLLFLDADAARARLMANPWIADAAVLKLYPDRLQITIKERQAFALWQKDRHVQVIAADGTVLEAYVERRYLNLPLVVGKGAETAARDFLAVVDQYPPIRAQLRASILVAQRRWNLRLQNGIDVELPESDVAAALERLVALDRDKKLLSRDIALVDLRLPDRVTVRLSDRAATERARRRARYRLEQDRLPDRAAPPASAAASADAAHSRHRGDRLRAHRGARHESRRRRQSGASRGSDPRRRRCR